MKARKIRAHRKRRAKRIHGDDRALMFVCKDIRRRWAQYGENRKAAKQFGTCQTCASAPAVEVDHIQPVGSRPRAWEGLGAYAIRMFESVCQALCASCHLRKTQSDRLAAKSRGTPKPERSEDE